MMSALGVAAAADITGTVVIQRRLTKPKVTLPLTAYERGVAVNVNPEPAGDPGAIERARVVIYVEGAGPGAAKTGVMEQRNRQFSPEVLVLPIGSTVSFPNLDPIFHNVFSLSKPRSFDLGNYPMNHTRTVTFTKPGVVFGAASFFHRTVRVGGDSPASVTFTIPLPDHEPLRAAN